MTVVSTNDVVVAPMDWVAWHDGYEDPLSPHSVRLRLIQGHIAAFLASRRSGPIRAVSVCSGDGRDLLGVLANHPRRGDVNARLVELDSQLASQAAQTAARAGLDLVEVVTADASQTDAYVGAVPADLVLVCGVFGNISDDDIDVTVRRLPQLCAPGATVIWTRHRRVPDVTPRIRGWFHDAQFSEVTFDAPTDESPASPNSRWAWIGVGVHRYDGPPTPLQTNMRMFSFIDRQDR